MTRRSFQRAGEAERRQNLVNATLESISDHGLEGATVRDIAARAGVTGGLIRHYFDGKDQMVQEAYREMLATMTQTAIQAMGAEEGEASDRLRRFIIANLSPPIADPKALSLWAAFISRVRTDEEFGKIHRENYLVILSTVEHMVASLLSQHGSRGENRNARELAIAINGLIDGLWLEASLAGDLFDETRLPDIALTAVEALLGGISLSRNNSREEAQ
ncbi:TetR family transcriptional regulator C-terminal domain-containing protein [Peteryoungia ipomoeae]|uniref:TetR family transcriptional regulator n=1 Tax=Peteryoungia ipomoeae TaxID=1210932 RepID=A0A4S8NZH9_9HYPH|nr:TetR family transcriptional regulator C-terminal domain-containing protein [Peteryoungia ipomoeae]THV22341.1 TetR family transcriptional regulator [Peteryoungia ipomoeae]